VAEEFQIANKGAAKVTVGISGTGGGFKKFCRGESDLQNASRPILKEEMENCAKTGITYIEMPVAFDALTILVSNKNTWLESITVEELKMMWEPGSQAKITMWNQINPKWPKEPLKLFGPGADSGTFDYFTEAIVGKAKSSRGDYTASEDDNVIVQGVSSDKNAIGYLGYSYYEANKKKLRAVKVIGGEKAPKKNEAIAPSNETVVNGNYYPLSRPLFVYLNEKSLEKEEVRNFVNFYITNVPKLSRSVNYVALPEKTYAAVAERIKNKQLGTAFGGHSEAGLHIDDIMNRSTTLKFAEKKK
jgi:phosphate transport system substrate-binding protein